METVTATQSDIDALTALSGDYIHSVQHGDVQRFDEILVRSYLGHNRLATNQLSDLITTVHPAIGQIGQAPEQEAPRILAVSVRRSVTPEYVVCLDCGYRGKTLRRHISTRDGLSRDQYLQRCGLRREHPLTAPAYSERRSSMAKTFGFGRKATVRVATTATVAIHYSIAKRVLNNLGEIAASKGRE
jgi:predicted transcriptional regulator